MNSLSYTSDEDRSFGAAGMAIGLTVYRGQDLIASISIDRDPSLIIELSHDYFFPGSPEVSPKASWERTLANYSQSVVMLISNVLCRTLTAHKKQPEPQTMELLRKSAEDEGTETCSLEHDEIAQLFSSRLDYLTQVFSHPGVSSVAHDLASLILSRRSLSRMDLLEALDDLNHL